MNTPTPLEMIRTIQFQHQAHEIRSRLDRTAKMRRNGVTGPLTRKELAARANQV